MPCKSAKTSRAAAEVVLGVRVSARSAGKDNPGRVAAVRLRAFSGGLHCCRFFESGHGAANLEKNLHSSNETQKSWNHELNR
jgi:hypothetical protein